MKIRLLKFVLSDFRKESRDKRELSVTRELGFETYAYGKGEVDSEFDFMGTHVIEAPTCSRYSTSAFNHLVSAIERGKAVRNYVDELGIDILSCHDVKALGIGYLATLGLSPRPALVYDSHEFELGRVVGGAERGRLATAVIRVLEGFLIRKSEFTIVPNDSIADLLQRVYGLARRPVVAYSAPDLWDRDEIVVESRKRELRGLFPEEYQTSFMLMYHGMVFRGRGIENVIEAVSLVPGTIAVIMGDGDAGYIAELELLAERLGVSSRVRFCEAVEREVLESYVAAADAGMIVEKLLSKNSYYYSLPNKFFENIQAETPLVVSDYPEMGRIVRRYDCGVVANNGDMDSVTDCVRRLMGDHELYASCKRGVLHAKEELCWERRKESLKEAYRALAAKILHGTESTKGTWATKEAAGAVE